MNRKYLKDAFNNDNTNFKLIKKLKKKIIKI